MFGDHEAIIVDLSSDLITCIAPSRPDLHITTVVPVRVFNLDLPRGHEKQVEALQQGSMEFTYLC